MGKVMVVDDRLRVTIPSDLARKLAITPGCLVLIYSVEGHLQIYKAKVTPASNSGS